MKPSAHSLAVAVADVLTHQKRIPIAQIATGAGISENEARSLLFKAMEPPTWAVVQFEYPPINGTVVTGILLGRRAAAHCEKHRAYDYKCTSCVAANKT